MYDRDPWLKAYPNTLNKSIMTTTSGMDIVRAFEHASLEIGFNMEETEIVAVGKKLHRLRIMYEECSKLYCARDIGDILGLKNVHTSLRIVHSNDKRYRNFRSACGTTHRITFLTHEGVIKVIALSRKPSSLELAKHFGIRIHEDKVICQETITIHQIMKVVVDLHRPPGSVVDFKKKGGYESSWFKSLDPQTAGVLSASYWNHLSAVLYGGPNGSARLRLTNDDDTTWDAINEPDLRCVWEEVVENYPALTRSWKKLLDLWTSKKSIIPT